ncbi:hypothetical protein FPOA_13909 [Fusarium poae]|jgi:hypothetical protein|uniref:Reverse transcriptase domain-containing protein n=1 Tax=Fusarium poae TaxID=36050 RepID=A0A1B8A431_FUSPO|nr:hypothetical protein FPOA_13909 [Fusarium poae]
MAALETTPTQTNPDHPIRPAALVCRSDEICRSVGLRFEDGLSDGRSVSHTGYTSERRELPQAGLPQGSPLSPVLFLFFNADLVQRKIDSKGGLIAFIDDYSAWVTGPTEEHVTTRFTPGLRQMYTLNRNSRGSKEQKEMCEVI